MIAGSPAHGGDPGTGSGARDAIYGPVELTMSSAPGLRILARLAVSTLAGQLGFDIEEIEDLRIAIDELCTSCAAGAGPTSRTLLRFEHDLGALRVTCTVDGIGDMPARVDSGVSFGSMTADELSQRILAELVDDYGIGDVTGGERRGHLEKRRQPAEH